MSNTVIQLKYSSVNSAPASLNVGEQAYSFVSNKLYIGNTTNGVLTIGGKYYTQIVDAATSSNTNSTLVLRDGNGDFAAGVITANLAGNATSATQLRDTRNINITGDGTGTTTFNGTADANVSFTLANSGVTAATYGGATQIPTFAVDSKGRITSAANVAIATTLNIAGDTGSDAINLLTDTVTFYGRDGLTSSVIASNNAVIFDVDNTVIRTTGNQGIVGDLSVTGNLNVTGTQVIVNTTTVQTNDSLIKLANNNTSGDVLDIGFYGSSNTGSSVGYHGLVREGSGGGANAGKFYLFKNLNVDPTSNVIAYANTTRADLVANITGGTVSGLVSAITVSDGGTGANTFASGQMLVGNGTGALQSLANTNTAGVYANASHVPVITTDVYGRVSSVTNTAISISASQVTSGILPIARGGTNNDSYTTGAMLQFDGSKIATLSNVNFTQTGTLAANSTVTSVSVDAYGRLTALTAASIAIDTSQITSGTLGVPRGGLGVSSLTTNGVVLGQGTSAVSTASSSTEGHVLTINGSGVPTFTMLSGGTF
jgi:hypothetical protein